MKIVSPVIPGLENYETPLSAKDDPISILRSPEGVVLGRWSFTQEEREAIARGGDILIWIRTANHPFHPVKLEVIEDGDPNLPREIKSSMRLDDQFELWSLLNDANKAAADLHERQLMIMNSDPEVNSLAVKAQQAKQALDRKKAEVFSDKPSTKIEVVQ